MTLSMRESYISLFFLCINHCFLVLELTNHPSWLLLRTCIHRQRKSQSLHSLPHKELMPRVIGIIIVSHLILFLQILVACWFSDQDSPPLTPSPTKIKSRKTGSVNASDSLLSALDKGSKKHAIPSKKIIAVVDASPPQNPVKKHDLFE